MLIPYPLTPTHDLVLLIDPCYFSKFLLPCISFKAVKVCIQTQQGFARGLSDGLSKIVKSKENLRTSAQVLIQVIPNIHFEKKSLFLSCCNFDPKSFRFISR
ncbi:uncharacterized protein LOC110102735 isoform X2 [Dendrobium catenatum]|uniref:uncharacterized protein LOC110102735 isoform X2 n=1 Tax=Dendrobium catenatum TaxID=906689 RepID=UPI00109F1346|nr:uncharacterized protein LOC110102735 isoform X2 [Dendrobium catenatum]